MSDYIHAHPYMSIIISSLYDNSPNFLIDLGVLFFIYGTRNFKGKDTSWTWVSVDNLSKRTKATYHAIQESLDRLVDWGIIKRKGVTGKYNNTEYLYKIVPLNVPNEWVTGELDVDIRRHILDKTPKSGDNGLPVVKCKHFIKGQIVYIEKVPGDEPTCPLCEDYYHQTEGSAPNGEPLCIQCWLSREIKGGHNDFVIKGRSYHMTEMPQVVNC